MAPLAYRQHSETVRSGLIHYAEFCPPVVSRVRKVLALCNRAWVRDFLFDPHPHQISTVSSQFAQQHAFVFNYARTILQPPSFNEDFRVQRSNASVACLPAFSIEGVTAGFGIAQNSEQLTQDFTGHSSNRNSFPAPRIDEFRFVVDHAAYLLVVPSGHHVLIEHVQLVSSTHRRRSIARLHGPDAHNLLKKHGSANHVPVSDLLACLHYFNFIDEYRQCPLCSASPKAPCLCPCTVAPPTPHPLDLSHLSEKLQMLTGSYEGVAHCISYCNGAQLRREERRVRVETCVTGSSTTVKRLTELSIRRYMAAFSYHDKAHMFPPVSLATPDQSYAGMGGEELESAPAEWGYAEGSALSVGGNGVGDVSASLTSAVFSPRISLVTVGTSSGAEAPIFSPYADGSAMGPGGSDELCAELGLDVGPALDPEQRLDLDPSWDPSFSLGVAGTDGVIDGNEIRLPVSPALPLMPIQVPPPSRSPQEEEADRKKKKKQERDRLAARRSNHKKKRENDERKANLKHAKNQEKELRQKEKFLRKENSTLRACVKEKEHGREGPHSTYHSSFSSCAQADSSDDKTLRCRIE